MAPLGVEIRFRALEAPQPFEAAAHDLKAGDRVVADTDRGPLLGTVIAPPRPLPSCEGERRRVLRRATPDDELRQEENLLREIDARRFVREQFARRGLSAKLGSLELALDGTRLTVSYSAEERLDLRELGRELAQHFHMRVEMRQLGARDEARQAGGVGPCGQPLCCNRFLRTLKSVSVKMAKEQSFPSTPQRINGLCGRLKCCLGFEVASYVEGKKALPACGSRCRGPRGEAQVVAQDPLARKLTLEYADGTRAVVPAAEVK